MSTFTVLGGLSWSSCSLAPWAECPLAGIFLKQVFPFKWENKLNGDNQEICFRSAPLRQNKMLI